MTRLRETDIQGIAERLHEYDDRLKRMTGASLRQIACHAVGVGEARIEDVLARVRFGAVPVRSGLGVIGGFSPTVAAIVSHLGFETFVTDKCDVEGIAEGVEGGGDVLMLADDRRFVALSLAGGQVVDNSLATAQGFVAALELMRGGVSGERVLVLGCGPVGVGAARALMDRGALVVLFDVVGERVASALGEVGRGASKELRAEATPQPALRAFELIFDATNAGGFIEASHLEPGTIVAAPGMPCGLTQAAMAEHGERVLHDALEIGTATMAVQAATHFLRDTESGRGDEG